MAEVILTHVNKFFDREQHAVKDFNLHVADQEFMVLVGPSGCGKSTTLRMIAGLEEISDGILEIGGKVVNEVAPKDRDIAMVFQNYALYPHMTVFENMAFGLKLRRLPRKTIQERVQHAATILQIEHLLERKPKKLSGGQRQRVAMGRAIVREPSVFLMDEPLSNLDAKLRVEMRSQIAQLHRRLGATMIYVTHDQVEAMTLGQRIVVMNEGQIMQVDTPMNLYEYPQNKFVAGFIGSPSMNFIQANVQNGAFQLADQHITPIGPLATSIKDYEGRDLIIGIRPEHLGLYGHSDTQRHPNMLAGKITVVEALGAHTDFVVDIAGQAITAKIEGMAPVQIGQQVELLIDHSRLHAFDPTTEQALYRGGPTSTDTDTSKLKNGLLNAS